MDTLVIDRPVQPACGHQPPRLGDLMHVSAGDGPSHIAFVESVADDGRTLVVRGPLEPQRRRDLIVTFQRIGAGRTEEGA